VVAGPHPLPFQATAEEMDCVLRWLDSPGVRLVDLDQGWSLPAHGAEGMREWIEHGYSRDHAGKDGWGRRQARPVH
jgi:DNA polymerase-3 subunit epsilon